MKSPAPSNLSRREFMRLGGLGAGATLFAPALLRAASGFKSKPASPDSRPNIFFIWTDQQSRHAMSNAGNTWLRTPAMDTLAREGVTFERAYCSDPICSPSRTSWITGAMPHKTTVAVNVAEGYPIGAAPLSRLMKDAGYDTGHVGKWHIPHPISDTDWHGFDFVRHAIPQYIDPKVVPACEEFLKQPRTKPFFLVASFLNPHDICEWARIASGIDDHLKNGDIPAGPPPLAECPPLPTNFEIPKDEPEVIRQMCAAFPKVHPTQDWPADRWRQYLWAYYRMIELVDSRIAQLLQLLRDTGQYDNTLIVFSSDHGDGAAAHRWNQKTLFYEETAGVPFIVRPPRCARAGQRDRKNLVNMNLDFFPTLFDYAGITPPAGIAGRSVRPLVEGRAGARGHEFVVSQNDHAPAGTVSSGVFGRMLRTDRYKYICYNKGKNPEQFFDLENDPGETRDLKNDPAHAAALDAHRKRLRDWMRASGDPFPETFEKS